MIKRFSPLSAQRCEINSSFKIRTGDVRPQVGAGRNIPKKPVWPGALVRMRLRRCWSFFICPQPFTACRSLRVVATAPRQAMPTSEHPAQLRHLRVVRLGDRGLSVAGLLADRTRSMPPSEVYGSGFNTHHDVYGPRRVCLVTY